MKRAAASRDLRVRIYRFLSGYGMVLVLLLLCVYYSWVTWAEQRPTGAVAAAQVAAKLRKEKLSDGRVLIVAGSTSEDRAFAERLRGLLLEDKAIGVIGVVT